MEEKLCFLLTNLQNPDNFIRNSCEEELSSLITQKGIYMIEISIGLCIEIIKLLFKTEVISESVLQLIAYVIKDVKIVFKSSHNKKYMGIWCISALLHNRFSQKKKQ